MSFEKCKYITSLLSGFDKPWFFAGGWAIDLFIGRETRTHEDIEIALYRKDQLEIKTYLKEWDFKKVVKGEFYLWKNEFLELPIHEIHAFNNRNKDIMEILLNETNEGNWLFRRNFKISYPLNSLWSYSNEGMPYLNPEITLLYKTKNTREKDHDDFITVKDFLSEKQKEWLKNAITLQEPNHKWIDLL
ncbi:nucleotidyltransferase domain-containing protein [Priestia megaterium]